MDSIRWGLLSTANINRRLIPAIRASKRGRLVAVASRDRYKAAAYAAKWDIPTAFANYQEMLESGDIDAVYIGLPNHLHAKWSIRAMRSGLHVLCEKPFALSLEETDLMISTSIDTGCVLVEAFMYRHHPQTKIAGEMAHSGRLGQIELVCGTFNFHLSNRDNVRLVPEYGGGCLWDVGVYPLSFAQYIYGGLPLSVSGMQWVGTSGVDESFIGQMVYPGRGLAQISSSFRSPFYTHIDIIGTEGRLSINRPFIVNSEEGKMIFYPKGGNPQEIQVPEKELYIGEVEDMHSAILDGSPTYLSLKETRNHILTALALYESASKGVVVHTQEM